MNRLFYIACAGLPFQFSIKKSVINDIFNTFIDLTYDYKSYIVVVVVVVLLRKSCSEFIRVPWEDLRPGSDAKLFMSRT